MDRKSKTRSHLMAVYARLTPLEKALMQLCSIIYEPVEVGTVIRCFRQTGLSFPERGVKSIIALESCLDRLQSLKLLNKNFQCPEGIVELCSREAVNTPAPPAASALPRSGRGKTARRNAGAIANASAANRFQLMARVVQQEADPVYWFGRGVGSNYCHRLMRNLRIAVYTQDLELLRRSHDQLRGLCKEFYADPEPLVRVANNPFEAAWFRTLSLSLQRTILPLILFSTLFSLESDAEALAYALSPPFRHLNPVANDPGSYLHAATRLMVGGRLEEAAKLLMEVNSNVSSFGMEGSLQFLRGEYGSASASFATDLKELRRFLKQRNAYFRGFEGVFCLLTQLISPPVSTVGKASDLVEAALARNREGTLFWPLYQALKAVQLSQAGEAERANALLAESERQGAGIDGYFQILARYWVNGRLDQPEIDSLSRLFIRSREMGLSWLALECAELLRRVEEDTPVRRNAIERIKQETGLASFVATIQVEEPWRRSLRALSAISEERRESGTPVADSRLAWLLDYSGGVLSVQPVEQKRTARGTWSKGRAVALSRLCGGPKPAALTPQDQAICATIEREGRHYYSTRFHFDMDRLRLALVGHPLLFLAKAPTVPVEVVKGEPEVMVTRDAADLIIRFSMESGDARVVLQQETPTRYKVVQLSEHHRRIARVLGENGLRVPASAALEVTEALSRMSSQITVHSAVGGLSRDLEEVAADPTPRVHIVPSGPGFRFEMFVQPFGASGPYLKPGKGMENIMGEIEGKLLHTRRDLKGEEAMAQAVEAASPTLALLDETERQWQVADPDGCLQILLDLKPLQDNGGVLLAWPEGEKIRVSREVSFDHLRLRLRSRANWFEVGGELQVDDQLVVDMKRLLELLSPNGARFLPLGDGQFVALTRELRKRLDDLADYTDGEGRELRLHPLAALALEDFTEQLPRLDADRGWKTRLASLHAALQLEPELPSTLKAELRDYQMEGYRWLARLAHLGLGGCLADDMGLGKTLQALALILQRAPEGPALVVAPTSVCMNWTAEANRFAPTLNLVTFGGNHREQLVRSLGAMDVLVVSYGLLNQEAELLASVQWHTIVLDEAQAIKNFAAKRSQAAMNLNGNMRLITTGTPIENHLGELWTLFNFINPGLLGSQGRFNARFAIPLEHRDGREARKRLKKLVQPFILRRTKAQVLEELPPRTEVVLQVELGPEETAFYEALRRQALERLELDDSPAGQKHLKILAEIMRLRRACCHPRLVMPATQLAGAKLELFGEVVAELLENRHKALVFSQFVGHLQILREYLDARNLKYRYLDGSTPPKERKREVDAFQAGSGDLFLISLKAGGLGLNLTAADYVIHMDPWWNPAVEDQASDRAHRIGQLRPVTVYRLVTRNTIEEKILKLHQEKRDLASSLLDGSDMVGRMSADELLKLVKEQ